MPRKSGKTDKSIYHMIREDDLNLSRDKASELLEAVTADRLEKIETGKLAIRPEEVVLMADKYKHPELCYEYCSNDCPIGQRVSHDVTIKDLSKITIEMLASLNDIEAQKNRLIEIVADGTIDSTEIRDFKSIQDNLEKISVAADSLKLWTEKMIADGTIVESSSESTRSKY